METVEINALATRARTDRDAMGDIIKAVQPVLISMIRKSNIHTNDQADAVQNVLIILIKCVQSFDPDHGDFSNYINSSANRYLKGFYSANLRDYWRDHGGILHENSVSSRDDGPSGLYAEELLAKLPKTHRDVVSDHYGIGVESRSINQIASLRRLSKERVKHVLKESMDLMRGNL